jgi:hypothetical protein
MRDQLLPVLVLSSDGPGGGSTWGYSCWRAEMGPGHKQQRMLGALAWQRSFVDLCGGVAMRTVTRRRGFVQEVELRFPQVRGEGRGKVVQDSVATQWPN